jgi:hypothetical protein
MASSSMLGNESANASGAGVAVGSGVAVGDGSGVAEASGVAVAVGVAVNSGVGLAVAVAVAAGVAVAVGVAEAVGVAVASCPGGSSGPLQAARNATRPSRADAYVARRDRRLSMHKPSNTGEGRQSCTEF